MSGARIAVRTTRIPDDLNTPANRAPSFVSWSQTTTCGAPKNGRGLDEQGCFTPSWRDSRSENNREALPRRPPDAAGDLPLGDDELLSKKRVLRNEFDATANEIRGQPRNEPKKVDHVSSLTWSTRGWTL